MNRREFLAALGALTALPLPAHASGGSLRIGIFPGTGTSDMLREELRAANRGFAQAVAAALGRQPSLTIFTALKSINRSIEGGRLDLYFAPPTVVVNALGKGYVPIVRVKDKITVMLVKRKDAQVSSIALTERESLPDVMGRYVLKAQGENARIFNLRSQEDVVLALERNYAQAGGLGPKIAKALIERGEFEAWHPLPSAPGFSLVGNKSLGADSIKRLRETASRIDPAVIAQMQKVFVAKLGGFVPDDGADLQVLKEAMEAAGYA